MVIDTAICELKLLPQADPHPSDVSKANKNISELKDIRLLLLLLVMTIIQQGPQHIHVEG